MLRRILSFKPPAGAALNWGHPLTNKLLVAWPATEGSGAALYDAVAYRKMAFANTGVTWAGSSLGTMARFTPAASGYAELADLPELNGLSQMTMAVRLYRMGNLLYDGIISRSTTGDVGVELMLAGALGGVDDIFFRISTTNADYGYTTDASIPLGVWVHVVAVFDGSQTGNANRMKVYVNGIQRSLTFAGTIPATTPTVSSQPLRLGRLEYAGGATNNYFNGLIDFPCIWTRALSADEADQLYANPYQILRPQGSRSLMTPEVAGGIFGHINNPIVLG